MRRFALVFAGGVCGTLARYALSSPLLALAHRLPPLAATGMPIEFLVINLTGALALGFVFGLVEHGANISHDARLALGTGFLGGYTTFSTLSFETHSLARRGHTRYAWLNALGSLVAGIVAAALGIGLGTLLH